MHSILKILVRSSHRDLWRCKDLKNYAGQICPYCRQPISEHDELAVCSSCGRPHHKACWQKNEGCTTPNCNGKMAPAAPPAANGGFCIHCGAKFVSGSKFCRSCGKELFIPAPRKAAPAAASAGVPAPAPAPASRPAPKPVAPPPPVTANTTREERERGQYEYGERLMDAGRYDEALQVFTKLAAFADSLDRAKDCLELKKNADKQIDPVIWVVLAVAVVVMLGTGVAIVFMAIKKKVTE